MLHHSFLMCARPEDAYTTEKQPRPGGPVQVQLWVLRLREIGVLFTASLEKDVRVEQENHVS